ncbi:MAG: hypothetical protein ACFFG0_40810, partial [Candidatus Thorarchaeota archaeon]
IDNEYKILLWNEVSFKSDLINLIDKQKRYTVFFTDDDVFKESWALDSEYFQYFDKYNLLGISLRMHPRMNYCYTKGRKMQIPEFNNNMWEWKNSELEWQYPMSIDGTVFLTNDILPILEKYNYENPNTLEKQMALHPINKKYIVCYNKSKIINIPLNRVQNVYHNNSMKIKPEYLNEKFLNGYRISLNNIIGIDNNSPHYSLEIEWEKI